MSKKSRMTALVAILMTASTLGFTGFALADSTTPPPSSWKESQKQIKKYLEEAPGVAGTVSSITGNTITLTAKNNTTYTIDASTAHIVKNRNTIITIGTISVGDTLTVKSANTTTNPIVATTIFDGKPVHKAKTAKSSRTTTTSTTAVTS